MFKPTNILAQFDEIEAYWSPKVIGQVNDQYVKVAKLKDELVWHAHDHEDELFYVVKGSMVIQFEDGEVTLNEGDFYVVPRGVRHNPVAQQECWIVLVETVSTKHTGDMQTSKTKSIEEQIQAD
jgi:mannose-6-phosphate isomerase-like protein (cupin superfamily)